MEMIFERTITLIGQDNMEKLRRSSVAVIGLGGVGSYACEALARSGIGHLTLVDKDEISPSNINRQIYALHSTIGQKKAETAARRILDINPAVRVEWYAKNLSAENIPDVLSRDCDFAVDAIDDTCAKTELILYCKKRGIPIISSMGAGNRLDASKLKICDIYDTSGCPLARVMRKKCRDAGVKELAVVASEEIPRYAAATPSSMVFVPAAAGIMMAGHVVSELLRDNFNA